LAPAPNLMQAIRRPKAAKTHVVGKKWSWLH
jgi:hypothetical protein